MAYYPLIALLASFVVTATRAHLRRLVIDGTNVESTEEFPFIVALQQVGFDGRPRFICTGSLLSNRIVLTAAHCVSEPAFLWTSPLQVISDTLVGHEAHVNQAHGVAYHAIHPKYNTNKYFDVAILVLSTPVSDLTSSGAVRTYPSLSSSDSPIKACDLVLSAGYGEFLPASPELLNKDDKLRVKEGYVILSEDYIWSFPCLDTTKRNGINEQVSPYPLTSSWNPLFKVSRDLSSGGIASFGDSGGPAFTRNEDGGFTLRGVLSGGEALLFEAHVDVTMVRDFIDAEIGKVEKGLSFWSRIVKPILNPVKESSRDYLFKIYSAVLKTIGAPDYPTLVNAMVALTHENAGSDEVLRFSQACQDYLLGLPFPNLRNDFLLSYVCDGHRDRLDLVRLRQSSWQSFVSKHGLSDRLPVALVHKSGQNVSSVSPHSSGPARVIWPWVDLLKTMVVAFLGGKCLRIMNGIPMLNAPEMGANGYV